MRNSIIRYRFILFTLSFLIINVCFGQQLDTSIVLMNLKVRLFSEINIGLLTTDAMEDYLKRKLRVTVLKSKGFDNIVFFKISGQVLVMDSIKESKKIVSHSTPICLRNDNDCCFVYAFNKVNNHYYRLKGTKSNDFAELYIGMDQWRYWKPISKIDGSTITKFIADFWADELDLSCLLRSLTEKKGTCLDYFSPKLIVE